jgi:hypothetical protein
MEILKKNKNNPLKETSFQPSLKANKAIQNTAKKNFIEIAKLNSLVLEQSIKLDK